MENWIIGQDKPEDVLKFIHDQADSTKKAPIVCFDYFDTLVTRCVEPEYTKQMASGLLSRLLKGSFTGESIYHCRKDIEYDLCLTSAAALNELEFCFEDLGVNLWDELKKQDIRNVLPVRDCFIKEMLAIEVAVEKAVQSVCAEVFHVIQTLHRRDFTLLLISDFYLPEKEFLEILSWHKLEHLFAKVYISSVHGRSKGSGRIYPMIRENLGVEFGQLLMIGDNPHADIKMSRQHGLQSIHLQRPDGKNMAVTRKKQEIATSADPVQPFQQIALPKDVPFPEIGISFWIFTHRLFEELNEHDVRNVFFLSKEGSFSKRFSISIRLRCSAALKSSPIICWPLEKPPSLPRFSQLTRRISPGFLTTITTFRYETFCRASISIMVSLKQSVKKWHMTVTCGFLVYAITTFFENSWSWMCSEVHSRQDV